jgi:hypothetical protein
VLAIISKDTRTPLERWVFDINLVEPPAETADKEWAPCIAPVRFTNLVTQGYVDQTRSRDPGGNKIHFKTNRLKRYVFAYHRRANRV